MDDYAPLPIGAPKPRDLKWRCRLLFVLTISVGSVNICITVRPHHADWHVANYWVPFDTVDLEIELFVVEHRHQFQQV